MEQETQKGEESKKLTESADAPAVKPTKKKKKTSVKKKVAKSEAPKKAVAKKKSKSASVPAPEKKPEPAMTFSGGHKEAQSRVTVVKKKRSSGKWVVLIAIIILALIFAGWYRTQQLSTESKETAQSMHDDVASQVSTLQDKLQNLADQLNQQNLKEKEQVFKIYQSDRLGITFQYPQELGDAKDDITEQPAKKGSDGPTEKVLTITFAGNPDISLVAATSGYESDQPIVYTGDTKDLTTLCDDPLNITKDGYCDMLSVAGQNTVTRVLTLGTDSVDGVMRSIPLNLSKDYQGLTVNLNLGLPPVSGRSLFAEPSEQDKQDALEAFFRNLIKQENLSLITKENIAAYEKILETLKISPSA